MMLESERKWKMEAWEPPPPLPRIKWRPKIHICPNVGIPLPRNPTVEHLKQLWFKYDPYNWHIKPFRRRSLYNLLKRNLDAWTEWLRLDSTPTFYREINTYRKAKDGAVIGIQGPKGSGKSWLGQMVLSRIVDSTPHVLFKYSDLELHISKRDDLAIGVQIDEDLKATGAESKNLVIHINNAFETSRKAELWAVCTGVNLSFEGWGDTLDLRLIPFGFNRKYQATRAAVWSKEREFLGFVVFQRKHLPDDPVYYYNEIGFWGEYKARAINYSLSVTKEGGVEGAVSSEQQDRHIAAMVDYLKIHVIDQGKSLPSDIKCRRLYRRAKLPSKSIGYMTEVIQWAKEELDGEERSSGFIPTVTAGWKGLRTAFHRWLVSQRVRSKTAWYLADWYIFKGLDQSEIGAQYGVGRDAVNKSVSRYRDIFTGHESELGIMAEKWVAAHTDSLHAVRGSGHRDDPDILLTVNDQTVALNVKLCLEGKFRRNFDSTPEDTHMPHAYLAVVHARVPVIRLYPITGPQTYAHHEQGVPCAPEGLGEKLLEMIS